MKLLEVELQPKVKLKVAIMIPPILWPTAAWGSRQWTVLRLECGKVFPLGVLVNGGHQSGAGQSREPRPGLGFLPWLVTQKYYLSKPPLVTSSPTPQASVGAAQSTAKSPRLLWATEWAESLWLLLVSPLAGVRYLLMIEIRAGFNMIMYTGWVVLLASPARNFSLPKPIWQEELWANYGGKS